MIALSPRNEELITHSGLLNTNRRLVISSSFRSHRTETRAVAGSRESSDTQAWAAGLERLRSHPPPPGFTEADWHQFKLDALALLAQHGPSLAALGWTTLDLFGLHAPHPGGRVSHSGLVRFLHGGTITEIIAAHARIRCRGTGSLLTFYRVEPQSGAVPAWAFHPEPEGSPDMAEYTMDVDSGATSSQGGQWLRYHAAPTRDGLHGAGTWSVRDTASNTAGSTEISLRDGLVFDWPNSRTGWMRNSGIAGQAPEKRWNASRSKFEPQPGKEWKRAIYVSVAWLAQDGPSRAVWEQDAAATWMAYCEVMALIRPGAPGELPKLPLLACTATRPVQMPNGGTLVPTFTLLRYIARPACLPEAEEEAPAHRGNGTVATTAGSAWAGAGSDLSDEIPF
jgi:hypothetical protein